MQVHARRLHLNLQLPDARCARRLVVGLSVLLMTLRAAKARVATKSRICCIILFTFPCSVCDEIMFVVSPSDFGIIKLVTVVAYDVSRARAVTILLSQNLRL